MPRLRLKMLMGDMTISVRVLPFSPTGRYMISDCCLQSASIARWVYIQVMLSTRASQRMLSPRCAELRTIADRDALGSTETKMGEEPIKLVSIMPVPFEAG